MDKRKVLAISKAVLCGGLIVYLCIKNRKLHIAKKDLQDVYDILVDYSGTDASIKNAPATGVAFGFVEDGADVMSAITKAKDLLSGDGYENARVVVYGMKAISE